MFLLLSDGLVIKPQSFLQECLHSQALTYKMHPVLFKLFHFTPGAKSTITWAPLPFTLAPSVLCLLVILSESPLGISFRATWMRENRLYRGMERISTASWKLMFLMSLQRCYENVKQLNIDTLRNGEKKNFKKWDKQKPGTVKELISNLQAGKVWPSVQRDTRTKFCNIRLLQKLY